MAKGKAEKFIFLSITVLFFLGSAFLIDVKHYRLKLLVMELAATALIVFFLLRAAFSREKIILMKSSLDRWVWFYFGYVILRYAFYQDKGLSQMEIEKNVLCVGLYCGFSQTVIRGDIKSVLKIFSLSAVLVAAYGLWQNFGTPLLWFLVPRISPPYATFGNQNFFAAYLVITLPFLFLLLTDKNFVLKTAGALGLVVYALDLIYIKSRGGILSALFGVFVFFIARSKGRLKLERVLAAVANKIRRVKTKAVLLKKQKEILLSVVAKCAEIAAKKSVMRYLKVFSIAVVVLFAGWAGYKTRSFWLRDTSRLFIWRDTIVMAIKNPLGVGPGAFAASFPKYASEKLKKIYPQKKYIVNFAHNEYLEIFAELGAPGLLLFLVLIFVFFRTAKNPYLIASAAGILFHNFFSVNMRFIISAGFLYVVFALAASETAEKVRIKMNAVKRGFLLLLAAGIPFYFVPRIFKPIKAYKETAREPDFFENIKQGKIARLESILVHRPDDYDILYKLGWFYAKKKDWRKASDYFLRAAKIRPTAGLWNNIGNIFFETGNRSRAIECYKNALRINPDLTDARFNLGYTYFYEGKLGAAAVCFNEVLKKDKNNAKALMMLQKMKE
ncbi:MAG: tetratricopeptide repeat protein [Elusimicrobia bacterium]|nr:tetratricopeptide repeat protein [Elusimicrobiota bacterium]